MRLPSGSSRPGAERRNQIVWPILPFSRKRPESPFSPSQATVETHRIRERQGDVVLSIRRCHQDQSPNHPATTKILDHQLTRGQVGTSVWERVMKSSHGSSRWKPLE